MDNDSLMIFFRNIAKDYKTVSDGSVLEPAFHKGDVPYEVLESGKVFDVALEMVSEAIGKQVREEIFKKAMEMLNKHEEYAFQEGFMYALTLAGII